MELCRTIVPIKSSQGNKNYVFLNLINDKSDILVNFQMLKLRHVSAQSLPRVIAPVLAIIPL